MDWNTSWRSGEIRRVRIQLLEMLLLAIRSRDDELLCLAMRYIILLAV